MDTQNIHGIGGPPKYRCVVIDYRHIMAFLDQLAHKGSADFAIPHHYDLHGTLLYTAY